MKADLIAWLDGVSHLALSWALVLFCVVNVVGVLAVVIRRDRALVDRWTPRGLAANFVALALGAGAPLLIGGLKLALSLLPDSGGATTLVGK